MTCIMSRLGETRTDPQQAEVEEPLFFMYLFILLYLIFYYYFIYIYNGFLFKTDIDRDSEGSTNMALAYL